LKADAKANAKDRYKKKKEKKYSTDAMKQKSAANLKKTLDALNAVKNESFTAPTNYYMGN
jgi:hypothetical protein